MLWLLATRELLGSLSQSAASARSAKWSFPEGLTLLGVGVYICLVYDRVLSGAKGSEREQGSKFHTGIPTSLTLLKYSDGSRWSVYHLRQPEGEITAAFEAGNESCDGARPGNVQGQSSSEGR